MDNTELIKVTELPKAKEVKDTDVTLITQDNTSKQLAMPILEQRLIDKTDGKYIRTSEKGVPSGVATLDFSGKLANEQIEFGEVKEGDDRVVSGGEVYDELDNNFKSNDKLFDIKYVRGKNIYNKLDNQDGKWLVSATGEIQDSASRKISGYIPISLGGTITVSGWWAGLGNKRISVFKEIGDKIPIEFFNSLDTVTINHDGYIVVYVSDPTADWSDTLQIEFGTNATEYEPFEGIEIEEKIKEEFLPKTQDIIVNNELSDGRFVQSFEKKEEYSKRFIDSLRKQRGSLMPNKSKTIYISNPYNKILESVIVPIHLCWNKGVDNVNGRHIYLNEEFEKDLTDFRFFNGSEMLESTVVSIGNYALLTDTEADYNYEDIIKRDDTYYTGLGCYTSTDLINFTLAVPNHVFAYVDLDGNIYAKPNSGKGNLVKFYKSTNYTTSKVVIEVLDSDLGPIWRSPNFGYDSLGNLYAGSYQTNFSVKVWKSTDGGETWSVVLGTDKVKSQHVHNLVVDRTVIPNKIYVSCDGNMNSTNGTEPTQWESSDYGVTWVRKDLKNTLGYVVDNGIIEAYGDVLLGGSEGAIKNCPAFYTSNNGGNTYDIHLWGQNIHTSFKIGDMYVAIGQNYEPYKSSNIYASYDLKEWFKIYEDVNPLSSGFGTGDGYRYGSYREIQDVDGTPCAILKSRNTNIPRLKMKVGEDYSSALVYVKINNLPKGGKTIRIENNYLVADPDLNLLDDNLKGDLNFPLNERVNKLPYADVEDESKWRLSFNYYGYNLNDKINIPFDKRGMVLNSDFGIEKPILIDDVVSLSFWYSYKNRYSISNYSILSMDKLSINIDINKTTLNVNIDSQNVNQTRALRIDSTEKPCMLTVIINKSTNKITVFTNEFKHSELDINLNTFNPTMLKLGNKVNDFTSDMYISDFNLYYKELTQEDVSVMFNKELVL